MIVKFRVWPRDMATQMCLRHIVMVEPPCEGHPLPRQIALKHLSMSYRRGRPRKSMTCQGSICRSQHRLSSGGAVRRNSLRCAPFGPPTVSCVLAPARTCLRQAPPTFRGRGLATSAVPHHLTDDMSMKAFILEKMREVYFWPIISHKSVCHEHEFKASLKYRQIPIKYCQYGYKTVEKRNKVLLGLFSNRKLLYLNSNRNSSTS